MQPSSFYKAFYLLCAFAFLAWAYALFWGTWSPDLSALYVAAKAIALGVPEVIFDAPEDPYSDTLPASWEELVDTIGITGEIVYPYLYPPLWAELLSPLTDRVSPLAFFDFVLIVQSLMLASMPFLGWKISLTSKETENLQPVLWFFLAFLVLAYSTPSFTALIHNQLQISAAFLILVAFFLYQRGALVAAGIVLALAAAIKLSPAFFGIIFLRDRAWPAVWAALVAGAGLLALSVGLAGWDVHMLWLARLKEIDGLTILSKINLSPEIVLYQLWHMMTGATSIGNGTDCPAWIQLLPKILAFAVLIAVLIKRALPLGLALLIVALSSALFGPLSWVHYFILPLMLLPSLFGRMGASEAWAWCLGLIATNSYPFYQYVTEQENQFLFSVALPTGVFCALLLRLLTQSTKTADHA